MEITSDESILSLANKLTSVVIQMNELELYKSILVERIQNKYPNLKENEIVYQNMTLDQMADILVKLDIRMNHHKEALKELKDIYYSIQGVINGRYENGAVEEYLAKERVRNAIY